MAHASGSTKTVLIGDDTAFVRERFTSALHEAGHQAVPVASLAELVAALETRPIDLILLDLGLPPARGTSVVRAIRSRDDGRTPIVVFSGTITDARQVRDLAEMGITAYVNEYSAPQKILASLAPHLFPDNFNRRSSPRVQVALAISYRIGHSIASTATTRRHADDAALPAPERPARNRRRRPRLLDRPQPRHGPPVRAHRPRRPDRHRRLRRSPLLQPPPLKSAPYFAIFRV